MSYTAIILHINSVHDRHRKGEIMTEKFEMYKCNTCGNLVQVLLNGVGELVCCGEKMELIKSHNKENDNGMSEKHSPTITTIDENTKEVKVENHPMTDEHYIMFVEYWSQDKNNMQIQFFKPEEKAIMRTNVKCNNPTAISYCNIHGLYTNDRKGE